MAKYILFFLAITSAAFAESYDDFYEKNSPSGDAYQYWEERSENVDERSFYDEKTDNETIPGGVDKSDDEKDNGYGLGASLKSKVGSEKGLKDMMQNMQSGGDLEPFSETYICPVDNVTYGDKLECSKSCLSICDIYKFQTSISCQNAKEVLRITPDHIGNNPPFSIKYQDKMYHTQKVDAVCGNGYMSGGVAYEWSFTKDGLNFVIPASNQTLGECRDMTGKPFMADFNDYYDPMIYALKAHLSKLGFVPSANINGSDFSLSVTVIVAGACDENSLKSDLPNQDAINQMREGKLDFAQAQTIASKDPNYSYITDGTDIQTKSCAITNKPVITSKSEEKKENGSYSICTDQTLFGRVTRVDNTVNIEFRGGDELGNNPFKNCPVDPNASANGGWFIAESFNVPADVLDVILNYSIPSGSGCNAGSGVASLALGTQANDIQCSGSGSQTPSISYTYAYSLSKDNFEIVSNDTCSGISSNCKELSESVCDLYGGNCIEIKNEGVSTGNTPSTFCNELASSADNYLVCSDGKNITAKGKKNNFGSPGGFFTTKHSYSCETKNDKEYDYSGFIDQNKTISDSLVVTDGGEVTFSGVDENGKPMNFKTNVTLDKTQCTMTCKVLSPGKTDKPIINSDGKPIIPNTVTQDGTIKVLPITSYKACDKSGKNWKCELESNETMLSDCECQDDFMDAILDMQLIDQSAKNMKCSTK